MGFTLEQIHRTINNLGRLMPAKPNKDSTREYSLKDSVFLMAPKLLDMRQMGFTTNELVKALLADDVDIKAPTLTRYLCEYQKNHGEEPDTNPQEKKKKVPKAAKSPSNADATESAEKPKPHPGQSVESGHDGSGGI